MNYRITTILLAVALLLVIGVPAIQAAPLDTPAVSVNPVAPAGSYDFTNHGTAWVPQVGTSFSLFSPKGLGMLTKVKVAGQQWVHIPMPYPSVIAGSGMYIAHVEFCAISTNGTSTRPIRWELWSNSGRFYVANITWPADNAEHCISHAFAAPVWQEDLGISVLLKFANTTDQITLRKAWVRVVP
jgi:hypothetical protein